MPANTDSVQTRASAVLLYHRVASLRRDVYHLAVTPEAFRSQLQTLTRHWQVVPLGDLVAAASSGRPPSGCVALTFDDGYLDNLDVALPILEEFSAPATFFLTTAAIDRPRRYWWDVLDAAVLANPDLGELSVQTGDGTRTFAVADPAARQAAHDTLYAMMITSAAAPRDALVQQLAALVPDERFDSMARPLLRDEVRRVARHPLIDVGAHTVNHLSLAAATPGDLVREVFDCRATLETAIGGPVRHFAYPHGRYSAEAVRTLEAAGFAGAVTCEQRPLGAGDHPLRLPRVNTAEESGASLGSRLAALAA